MFTREDRSWLHPTAVSDRLRQLYETIDLPPVRLHDLRHGAASIAHAAGADLHAIKEMLGHFSIAVTSDTYTTLLPQVDRALAEAAASLVPRAQKLAIVPPPGAESAAQPVKITPSAHANDPGRGVRGRR
ncbi:tyrosine-type recombinase/integrase [Streptacidiphilus sp. N1-12]|uniref:Tyrosine-type recombinase/integrase n=2 Tax=Streptacidiphilus alkalitolerans TaxID=3342712 RepID=A0ABV6V753_9ACTN